MAREFLNALAAGQQIGSNMEQQQRSRQLRNALAKGDMRSAVQADPGTAMAFQQEQRLGAQFQNKQQQQQQEAQQGQKKKAALELLAIGRSVEAAKTDREKEMLIQHYQPQLEEKFGLQGEKLSPDEWVSQFNRFEPMLMASVYGDLPTDVQKEMFNIEGKQTERDKRVEQLVSRGLPRTLAEDIAAGDLVTQQDDFGNLNVINPVTGEVLHRISTRVGGQQPTQGAQQQGQQPQGQQDRIPIEETQIGQAAEKGTGVVASGRAALANLFGALPGRQAPETQDARQKLRVFNQEVLRGIVNNPRFPVAEQERIRGFLPNPDQIFQDPEQTAQNVGELRNFLSNKLEANQRTLQEGSITTDKQAELSDQNAELRRLLEMIDQPAKASGGIDQQGQSGDIDQELRRLEQRERELMQRLNQ